MSYKSLFLNRKFPTKEELKAKESTFSVGDRVRVVDTIRCRQAGKSGTIIRIDPEDRHGWKSFVIQFDDTKYGSMGFNSGYVDKIPEKKAEAKPMTKLAGLISFSKQAQLGTFRQPSYARNIHGFTDRTTI